MRISYWSSDVCSSDLWANVYHMADTKEKFGVLCPDEADKLELPPVHATDQALDVMKMQSAASQWLAARAHVHIPTLRGIGSASFRVGVFQYVYVSFYAVSL